MSFEKLVSKELIGKKDVFTFDCHHIALIPWRAIAQNHEFNVQLLTLDHHTDTKIAFSSYASRQHNGTGSVSRDFIESIQHTEKSKLDRLNQSSIELALQHLRHDEHIDAAVSARILTNAYVISYSDCGHINSDQVLLECKKRESMDCIERIKIGPIKTLGPYTYTQPKNKIVVLEKQYNYDWLEEDSEGFDRPYLDSAIESHFIRERLDRIGEIGRSIGLPTLLERPYILDIDLDYFATTKAVHPSDPTEFHKLIRGACSITIAREPSCVADCRLDGETIDASSLERTIKQHINDAQIIQS